MRNSRILLFGLCLLLFPLLISIPNSYAQSKTYENQEYGFTIEYPSEWILNDAIPQKNKWIEIVSFLPDTKDWSQGIYVNKWDGDLKDKNFDSNEYLENHNKAAQDWCSSLSISENGFACMNYSLIEQKTVSISGRQSFLLEETWNRIEGETSSEVLVYNLQIPDGEDRWTIIAESRKEILDETSNILKNSLDSFTLLDELQQSSFIEKISSPKQQLKNNVALTDISCKNNMVLIFKATDQSPACVKSTSVEKLIERGWGIHFLPNVDSTQIKNSELKQNGKYDVETSQVNYGDSMGFLANPVSTESFPGVIMIHEWWGLNENMKETATKLAAQGYVVLAVDLFDNNVANDAQKAMQMISDFEQEQGISNMNAAVDYLQSNHNTSKIGSIGWCFGGGQSLNLALNNEEMDATVIYYGRLVTEQDTLSKIHWPVLGIFAELDQGIPVKQVGEFENSLDELGISNEIHIYPGVDHAFANPTGERYAPAETDDAWEKTLKFLKENLS